MKRTITIVVALLLLSLSGCAYLRGFLNENTDEILIYLQTGDAERLRQQMKSDVACKASRKLQQETMPHTPVYARNGQGVCVLADVEGGDQDAYFSDQVCEHAVSFMPAAYAEFCNEIISLDKPNTVLGNAATWTPNDTAIANAPTRKWTLPYGSRMKLTIDSLDGKAEPFMKRVNYKTIKNIRNPDGSARGNGTCKLEMRIYKRDIGATHLQPLVSIHGGSWKLRTAGFPGLEASISHYTDRGSIVFAPFYRLAGNKEGNTECNNAAWQDMVADVEDALTWVWQNGEALGAAHNRPVALTGQSAGGHLATWLLAHPERHSVPISRALILYPPTDFRDFISHAVAGDKYQDYRDGIKTMENFFGVEDIAQVSTDDLAANSFPDFVRRNPNTPPVFIIHGVSDKTVPSLQSVRLCNAYERGQGTDNFDNGPAMNDGGDPAHAVYMRQYDCGPEGKLHLFAESDHAFDLSCIPEIFCLAGSKKTIPVLQESLEAGRNWLLQGSQ